MRKNLFIVLSVLIAMSMLLASCATPTPQTVYVTQEVEKVVTQEVEKIVTQEVIKEVQAPETGPVEVRWFVGLGTGTNADQQAIQSEVVFEFNQAHPDIKLVIEVVPYNSARDALSTEIASGNAPDLVGPVGWGGSNDFYGNWLDISSQITDSGFDTSIFNPSLVEMYQTEEGQVGLPFMVFPAAVYYNPALFDEAGLAYPPAKYGDKYTLDGKEVEWNWDTFIQVAKLLTVDENGNNATEDGFDATKIAQYGFEPQWQNGRHWTAWFGGQEFFKDGKAVIPEAARYAYQTYFDAMWGKQPWIPTDPARSSNLLAGGGGAFSSGRVGMAITHAWYTCCLADLMKAGGSFEYGILPSYNGTTYGRVDADTFRILKTTKHPKETFEVLKYLVTDAAVKLSTVYGGMPARTEDQQAWLTAKQEQFPFVKNWDTLLAGLAYPDVPSAEGYIPNGIEANNRVGTFWSLMGTDNTIDVAAEIDKLQADLQVIFDKKP